MVIQVISVVLYIQCVKYNICSAWFLDIRISTCVWQAHQQNIKPMNHKTIDKMQ